MKKFEYKILHYCEELDANTITQWNELGQEGWELVGISPYAMEVHNETDVADLPMPGIVKGGITWVAAAFKREIEK